MASCASGDGLCAEASAVDKADDAGMARDAADVTSGSPVMAALTSLRPPLDSKIDEMKGNAKALKAERKRVAKDLRNAEKRRRRLRARCKELPAEDLLEVLAMRRVRGEEEKRVADAELPD